MTKDILDALNDASFSKSYHEKTEGKLEEGDFRIVGPEGERVLQICLYRYGYPHNLIGITQSGNIVAINFTGDKFKGRRPIH